MQNNTKHTSAAPLTAKLRSAFTHARYIPQTLHLVWDSSGGWSIAWVALLLLQGLLPIAIVYLMRAVVNALVAASAAGADWPHIRTALLLAAPLGAVMLLTEALRSVANWVGAIQADLVSCRVADLLHQKCVEADLALYETPEFYDQLHQARHDAAHRPLALVESIGGLFQNGVTLVGMAAVGVGGPHPTGLLHGFSLRESAVYVADEGRTGRTPPRVLRLAVLLKRACG